MQLLAHTKILLIDFRKSDKRMRQDTVNGIIIHALATGEVSMIRN